MDPELISELEKMMETVNSDYVLRKLLPSEPLVVELRTEDGDKRYFEISEYGVRALKCVERKPDAAVIGDSKTILKMLRGEEDPIWSFFRGKVKVEGSLDFAFVIYERVKTVWKLRLKR